MCCALHRERALSEASTALVASTALGPLREAALLYYTHSLRLTVGRTVYCALLRNRALSEASTAIVASTALDLSARPSFRTTPTVSG